MEINQAHGGLKLSKKGEDMRFIRRIVFQDGSWIEGRRCIWEEPSNCLRIVVRTASPELKQLIGEKVSAHYSSMKYWYTVK